MRLRNGAGIDYGVLPLEGLLWAGDMAGFSAERKDEWLWTMLIMQPGWITAEMAARAMEERRY